jgi:hypothetical protein
MVSAAACGRSTAAYRFSAASPVPRSIHPPFGLPALFFHEIGSGEQDRVLEGNERDYQVVKRLAHWRQR